MQTPDFTKLLSDALTEPGKLSEAYSCFHNYSVTNAMLAMWECSARGIAPGPINTYKGWLRLGRQVVKGSKAISLIMPVTCKVDSEKDGEKTSKSFMRFILRANWFVLAQTTGEEIALPELPEWSSEMALSALDITRVPFDLMDGNCQGYATRGRKLAVSPVAVMPHKTLVHEIAHILLGHCDEAGLVDNDKTPRDIREVEAESVAYIVTAVLNLPGLEESRGYIRHWLTSETIPEKSAQKIFATANAILKAGKPKFEELS